MEVRLAILADAANVSQEGKLNILGEFNTIWAATFPVALPRMVMVLKLEASMGEGARHKLGIRVIDQDAQAVAPPIDGEVQLGPPVESGEPMRTQVILQFDHLPFSSAGTFAFEVLVDGRRQASVPLYVRQRAKNN